MVALEVSQRSAIRPSATACAAYAPAQLEHFGLCPQSPSPSCLREPGASCLRMGVMLRATPDRAPVRR